MSTDVTVETTIARPRAEVWRYTTDWRNDPSWIGAVDEAKLVTQGEFGVGSQVSRTASFAGKRFEYVNEIVDYEPESRLGMRSVKGTFPMTVAYEFEDADGGTRVRIHAQGDASGFYRFAGPALNAMVKRGIGGDLKRLKRVLEELPAGGVPRGDRD
jgi:uncharacterized protein YndB with AHSA1/START domain